MLLLLHQLHRRPERGPNAEGGPPGAPRGPPSSPDEEGASEGPSVRLSSSSSSNSSSSSSSSRDMLLQLLAYEIMPQFFAHTSIQNLLSLLQQHQHNPERLSQVGPSYTSLFSLINIIKCMHAEALGPEGVLTLIS